MIEITVFSQQGAEASTIQVDEQKLGGKVRKKLLKQAVMMYEANLRQGTVKTKQRNEVAGSTRKLYPQKHTGNARMGMVRTPSRRGGGRAFGPRPRDFGWQMPKKAKRVATQSAILAKFKDGEVKIVDSLAFDSIKTKHIANLIQSLKLKGSCLLVSADYNKNLVLSTRNIERVSASHASDLNCLEILKHKWLVLEKQAVDRLTGAAS